MTAKTKKRTPRRQPAQRSAPPSFASRLDAILHATQEADTTTVEVTFEGGQYRLMVENTEGLCGEWRPNLEAAMDDDRRNAVMTEQNTSSGMTEPIFDPGSFVAVTREGPYVVVRSQNPGVPLVTLSFNEDVARWLARRLTEVASVR